MNNAISDELYFELVAETARKVTGKRPFVLRNPFTGAVFWVQGMENCPRELFHEAAEGLDEMNKRDMLNALLH